MDTSTTALLRHIAETMPHRVSYQQLVRAAGGCGDELRRHVEREAVVAARVVAQELPVEVHTRLPVYGAKVEQRLRAIGDGGVKHQSIPHPRHEGGAAGGRHAGEARLDGEGDEDRA